MHYECAQLILSRDRREIVVIDGPSSGTFTQVEFRASPIWIFGGRIKLTLPRRLVDAFRRAEMRPGMLIAVPRLE